MPPKRNDKKTIVNLGVDQEQDDILKNPVQSEDGKMASSAAFRRCFGLDLFTKFFKMMKDELNEFGKSLIFLSSKYDEIAKFENEMRESLDNCQQRTSDYVNECQCSNPWTGCSLRKWDGKCKTVYSSGHAGITRHSS